MAWLGRQDLEDREHRTLNKWATCSNDSGGRRLDEPPDPMRTAFQRDRDRIIHCTAFRRLQHKTQVLAAFDGDHFRSRMTHSLEVSQMARGVTTALRLNPDLAEAIALAHDLGHPPFGHVGEDGLAALMANHGGFRHNAQGVRIVDYLEDRYGHGHGLNLTLAVRRSLLKGSVPPGFPLSQDLQPRGEPPLEAHIVDVCDKIAYLCHDLDDGLRVGAFPVEDAQQLELWRRSAATANAPTPHRIISEMVALLIHDLVETTAAALDRAREAPPRVAHSKPYTVLSEELQRFLRQRFYRARMVLAKMEAGRDKILTLFDRLRDHPEELPPWLRPRHKTDGRERVICDYLAGMTDRFLVKQPS